MTEIKLLDVVALTTDLPAEGLLRGQVGSVVDTLASGTYEVEFCDDQGRTYASVAIADDKLMVLRYQPARAA